MDLEHKFENLLSQIDLQGFGVLKAFLDDAETSDLADVFTKRLSLEEFKEATISKSFEKNEAIRGDKIYWLEDNSPFEAELAFMGIINELKGYINRTCFLGLRSFELHYALYPIGKFYKRHLDQFKNDTGRKLTVIFYLNKDWKTEDGGQLRIYLEDGTWVDVLPEAGTFVLFLSDKLEHEVLPGTRERKSITGWLKNKSPLDIF